MDLENKLTKIDSILFMLVSDEHTTVITVITKNMRQIYIDFGTPSKNAYNSLWMLMTCSTNSIETRIKYMDKLLLCNSPETIDLYGENDILNNILLTILCDDTLGFTNCFRFRTLFLLHNCYKYNFTSRYTHKWIHRRLHEIYNTHETACSTCNKHARYYRALIALRRLDKTIPDYTTGSWNERKYAVIGQWI